MMMAMWKNEVMRRLPNNVPSSLPIANSIPTNTADMITATFCTTRLVRDAVSLWVLSTHLPMISPHMMIDTATTKPYVAVSRKLLGDNSMRKIGMANNHMESPHADKACDT